MIEAVRRWPLRFVRAFEVLADADPGGVLVHCSAGRDRTGQVVAMLLQLVGVEPETIADHDETARRAANADLGGSGRRDPPAADADDPDRGDVRSGVSVRPR